MSRPLNNDLLKAAEAAPAGMANVGATDLACELELKVEFAGSLENLSCHSKPWHELARNSIEPSVIAAPEWQLPLFEHMRDDRAAIDVLLVNDCAKPRKLRAVVPFVRESSRFVLPLPVITSWTNDLFFLGVPLIDRTAPQVTLRAGLEGAAETLDARAAMFRMLPRSGPFAEALRTLASEQGLPIAEFEPFERAGLVCDKDYDAWFNESFSRKRRKEFRRLRSRLGEQGELEFVAHQPGEPLKRWIDDFIQLERAGWKGDKGTAVACMDDISGFLDQTLARFDQSSGLLFWKLSLDGKTIATLFGVICDRNAWLIKIAYDEARARYSPGVLLMLDVTRDLLERGDIDVVDSSAIPDHPMINHLWRDRIAMTDIMIATPGTSRVIFRFMACAEYCGRRVRTVAKSCYHRLLKRGSK